MDHRQERMNNLIIKTFFECLEEKDFSQVTVGEIAEKALINRSSFYRYYTDKYALRDTVVDGIVQDFEEHMEVDFLHMDVKNKEHTQMLEAGLARLCEQKKELEILWKQQLLGRNVFEEMLDVGAHKVEAEIRNQPTISDEKKQYADWYARLLVNNYLVTVRWWFAHSDSVSPAQITDMMKRHMLVGTIPTLKETAGYNE